MDEKDRKWLIVPLLIIMFCAFCIFEVYANETIYVLPTLDDLGIELSESYYPALRLNHTYPVPTATIFEDYGYAHLWAFRSEQYWHYQPAINYRTVFTKVWIRTIGLNEIWAIRTDLTHQISDYRDYSLTWPGHTKHYFPPTHDDLTTTFTWEHMAPGEETYGTDKLRLCLLLSPSANTRVTNPDERIPFQHDLYPPPSENFVTSSEGGSLIVIYNQDDWNAGVGGTKVYLDGNLYGENCPASIWVFASPSGPHSVRVVYANELGTYETTQTVNVGYDPARIILPFHTPVASVKITNHDGYYCNVYESTYDGKYNTWFTLGPDNFNIRAGRNLGIATLSFLCDTNVHSTIKTQDGTYFKEINAQSYTFKISDAFKSYSWEIVSGKPTGNPIDPSKPVMTTTFQSTSTMITTYTSTTSTSFSTSTYQTTSYAPPSPPPLIDFLDSVVAFFVNVGKAILQFFTGIMG